jgi:RNA polymerase subunit RPABC4/transcription elongation factor Spt4
MIYVRFDVTKNGVPREVPLNWSGFEQHLRVFLTWYYYQHPRTSDPKAWLFPRTTDLTRPVPRNFAYLVLKRAARRLAKTDPDVQRYLEHIHPHQFRHTRVYELVFQNWNIRWIMYYFGWRKVDMVLRYTQAFELKQVYRMLNGRGNGSGEIKICPRCHALVPENAKYCPYCGLKLTDHDMGKIIQTRKDKEQLRRQLLKLIEELGVDALKELLVSH